MKIGEYYINRYSSDSVNKRRAEMELFLRYIKFNQLNKERL